jgi:dolichyl-phosphate beta-glucosyltransferase
MTRPDLALTRLTTAVPAYNEGDRLPAFLADWVSEGLRHAAVAATLVVIDDGSTPDNEVREREAAEAAETTLRASGAPHRVAYLRAPRNQGKGASIRMGWALADAGEEWLGFIDGDGAIPAREFWRVAALLPSAPSDAVCGSRVKMAGRSVERSLFRHIQGRVFATCAEELFHLGFYDTQCGLKFFRAGRLRPLLPRLREDRWLLDIEVLDLFRSSHAAFSEIPIDCCQRRTSSLVFGVDPLKMAVRLFSLRRRLRGDRGDSR